MGLSCLSVLSPHHKNIERAKPSSYQSNPNHNNIELHITITMKIKWMEAKMFYGASSIPNDGSSAVGKLLSTAEKYVDLYGNGVMIFAYGCGQELASKLYKKGVLAMDASPCDLTLLKEQQRTWCADQDGTILI